MKNIQKYALILGLGALIAGCNQSAKDSKAKADSANYLKDSANKTIPHPGPEISGDDAKFAVEAANGGMAEVILGKLAMEKASDPRVKDFGAMMVKDHSQANAELKKIAAARNITLPDSISADEQKLKNDLSAKSGADFDKAYVQAMLDDHKDDIKAFKEAANKVKYPDLLAFVKKTTPVLQTHLDAIQKIHDGMK